MARPPRLRVGRLVLAGVALYYAAWGGTYSVWDLWRLHRRLQQEEMALRRLRQENDSLARWAARLASDPETWERVARERYGLVRRGERLYRFLDDSLP